VSRIDHPNGTYTEYQYDAAGRVTSVVNHSASSVHTSFVYTYDTAGRIQSSTTPQGTATYAHDADGRLTSATLPGHSVQYTYDAAGNRVSATEDGATKTYTTNVVDQYTAAGPLALTYDAAGNLTGSTGSGSSSYTYDDEGRLIAATTPADAFAYEYDVLGHRSAVIKNGVRTDYLVDPQGLGEVVGEYVNGVLAARYVRGLSAAGSVEDGWAAPAPGGQTLVGRMDAGGAAGYYKFDALGSMVGLSGAGGALLNQYSYLPFGQIAAATEAVANPFKFAGGWGAMDDGSELLYMRRRFYAPSLGRFTGPDPLRDPGSNAYAYVRNSPLAFADPSGLAVTADRFGGFADSLSYGEGAGATVHPQGAADYPGRGDGCGAARGRAGPPRQSWLGRFERGTDGGYLSPCPQVDARPGRSRIGQPTRSREVHGARRFGPSVRARRCPDRGVLRQSLLFRRRRSRQGLKPADHQGVEHSGPASRLARSERHGRPGRVRPQQLRRGRPIPDVHDPLRERQDGQRARAGRQANPDA
jgi:RHS repeat-associated protein